MRALRSQFFLTYILLAAVGVYIPVLLDKQLAGVALDFTLAARTVHLGSQEIKGVILAFNGLAIVLAPVLMAWLADTRFRVRTLLAWSFFVCFLGAGLLAWAGRLPPGGTGLVAALSAGYILYTFAVRPQGTLQDGLYFAEAHATEARGQKPAPYASVRIFGSLGYLVPLLALGAYAAYENHHGRDMPMWLPMLAGSAVAVMAVANTLGLPLSEMPAREGKGLPTLEAAAQVSRFGAWPMFWGMSLVHAGTIAYFSYQPTFLKQNCGLPEDWISWVPALDVLLELVPMLFAPWMVERFGAKKVLLAAVLMQGARYVAFALAPALVAPWCAWMHLDADSVAGRAPMWAAIGFKGLLHGPIIVGLYVVPPILLNRMATPTCRSSTQALYTMLSVGGGVLVGNLVFGAVAQHLGLPAVFLGSAGLMVVGAALLLRGRWSGLPPAEPAVAEEARARPAASSAETDT